MLDSIGTAIASVNASMELVRAISSASDAIERAELRLKAADVMGSLAEVKVSLVESQDEARQRLQEIWELREALEIKGAVVKVHDAMYLSDDNGDAKGDPFCIKCWQDEHRLRYLVKGERTDPFHHCSSCRAKFQRGRSSFQMPSERPGPEAA